MNLHKEILCTAGAALLLSSTNLFAEDQSARDILNKAYQTMGNMDNYAFTAVVVNNTKIDPITNEIYKHNISVKVDRPNNLRVDTSGTVKNRSFYLNDNSFTMIDHKPNYYGEVNTPKGIDASLDFLFEKIGIKAPIAQLIYSDMDKKVKFKFSKYFGTKLVGGVECDYVAFKNASRELHIWITTGDKPLIKSYSIINTSNNTISRINTTIKWNTNANISDNDFIFIAPKGSSKISINRAK